MPNQCKCIYDVEYFYTRIMKKNIESNIVLAFNKMSFDKMYTGKCSKLAHTLYTHQHAFCTTFESRINVLLQSLMSFRGCRVFKWPTEHWISPRSHINRWILEWKTQQNWNVEEKQ